MNHHQQHLNSRAEQELPDHVSIANSLRAVLSNYIQREKYQKKTNFDTVIQDRIISAKSHLKKKKEKTFISLTMLSIPLVFVASIHGWFADPINILIALGAIFVFSYLMQAYHAFIIRGNISLTEEYERIGVKKAFYDIFFETKTSVQLVYYYAIVVFLFFIALDFMDIGFFGTLEAYIFKIAVWLMGLFKIYEIMFHPKIIYVLIFLFPLVWALGDFAFWVTTYGGVKRAYGDHE